ncbi:MAG: ATP-binding protein [Aquisalimonadaceae bacterium]
MDAPWASGRGRPLKADGRRRGMTVAALLGLAVTLYAETLTPLGVAHGALYPLIILLAALGRQPRLVLLVSVVGAIFILVGIPLSPPPPSGISMDLVVANRSMSVAVVLVTGALALMMLRYLREANTALEELERTNQVLRQNKELLEIASESGHIGGWSADLETQRVYLSEEALRICGKPSGYTLSVEAAIAFYTPEYGKVIRGAFERCARDGAPFDEELLLLNDAGEAVWVRSIGKAVRDASGAITRVQGALQDIDQRKRAERSLQDLAERLTATLESITDGFFLLDRQWRFSFVNGRAESILRRRRVELLGQSIWDAFPEAIGTRFEEAYRKAVETGESVSFNAGFEPLDLWVDVRAYPSAEGLAVYFLDMTERHRLEQRLQQAKQLESVGKLTGGIAHDFNNLLTVIMGNIDLLGEQLDADSPLRPVVRTIGSAAQRGADLTHRLLAFARRQPLEPRAVNVNALLTRMEDLLRPAMGDHIAVTLRLSKQPWHAMVDPAELESAVLNVCINARAAMPDGGRLTLETINTHLDETYTDQGVDLRPGEYVVLAVSDTGHGIAAENLSHVFEPFFTTRPQGQGSGLGLSVVFGFIKQSRGHITIYSEPGQGTTVKLYLPRCIAGEEQPAQDVVDDSVPRGGQETILLVEDGSLVLQQAQGQLRALGYQVLCAEGGQQALTILDAHPEIDLLFTDMTMPGGMSGKQLAEAARSRYPNLKVLFTSGYTENAIVHAGRLDAGLHLLSKPYRRKDLARKLRTVLEEDAHGTPAADS